jgi:lipoprotein-anchoring transpeptidase ErfK/SrfK
VKVSRRLLAVSASVIAVAAIVTGVVAATNRPTPEAAPSHTAVAAPTPTPTTPYVAPTAAAVAALPEAKYDAVIPGLVAVAPTSTPVAAQAVYKIAADAPLYAADQRTPVARFAALNFLQQPSVIVPAQSDGPWTLVLTPSRQARPSQHPGAAAQSAGWIRTSLLIKVQTLSAHILVSVGKQTVSIVDAQGKVTATFQAGVGASGTPTPTNVMGYMEARYLDPAQNQRVYPIGLTSLHSSAADEPFGGHDGGLIGIHYEPNHSGNISHGCVRLDGASITALDQLPLGTSVIIEK